MKSSRLVYVLMAWFALALSACSDPGAVIDNNTEMPNKVWAYSNRVGYNFKIDDANASYNCYVNLRVTGNYKYSNLFVLITDPVKKNATTRYELKLAQPDGQWLGKGSGNLYSFRIPFKLNYKFPAAGSYYIRIEQNMRDNPLHEVSDVGLRVEKAK
ncbi:gliding motility lipoprotein GldH [Mucilaginibacter auburnensis]|uniref:Gliding motility-associated lipoprotein GldH n=1 Tax=Mucilaginibacter auburnensis TaxID=1457233 RepID=A0A2H9VRA6_9SPHI|nr:gliding motility lipoprotein GldH [Mucilaginibacter auburnensis]PJJ83357.1 gliding motility-associated lipoprotein GldH [Mucilaginibacter auburnensis]